MFIVDFFAKEGIPAEVYWFLFMGLGFFFLMIFLGLGIGCMQAGYQSRNPSYKIFLKYLLGEKNLNERTGERVYGGHDYWVPILTGAVIWGYPCYLIGVVFEKL